MHWQLQVCPFWCELTCKKINLILYASDMPGFPPHMTSQTQWKIVPKFYYVKAHFDRHARINPYSRINDRVSLKHHFDVIRLPYSYLCDYFYQASVQCALSPSFLVTRLFPSYLWRRTTHCAKPFPQCRENFPTSAIAESICGVPSRVRNGCLSK